MQLNRSRLLDLFAQTLCRSPLTDPLRICSRLTSRVAQKSAAHPLLSQLHGSGPGLVRYATARAGSPEGIRGRPAAKIRQPSAVVPLGGTDRDAVSRCKPPPTTQGLHTNGWKSMHFSLWCSAADKGASLQKGPWTRVRRDAEVRAHGHQATETGEHCVRDAKCCARDGHTPKRLASAGAFAANIREVSGEQQGRLFRLRVVAAIRPAFLSPPARYGPSTITRHGRGKSRVRGWARWCRYRTWCRTGRRCWWRWS
jgi:hypothetical protein